MKALLVGIRWQLDQDKTITRRQRRATQIALKEVKNRIVAEMEPCSDSRGSRLDFLDCTLRQGYRNAQILIGDTSTAVHYARCGWVVTVHTLGASKKSRNRQSREMARMGLGFVDRDLAADLAVDTLRDLIAPPPSVRATLDG